MKHNWVSIHVDTRAQCTRCLAISTRENEDEECSGKPAEGAENLLISPE